MSWLRDAPWFDASRLRAYGGALAILSLYVLGDTVVDLLGWRARPPGDADFLSFHAAARLALDGQAPAAWDRAAHALAQTASQGLPGRYFAFFYPPTFLLLCLPVGLLPLLPAMLAWVVATGAAFFALLRAWLPGAGATGLVLAVLAPAAVLNAVHGQNAFLTGALLAVAGLALDRRPALAGLALATLAFKPQLGLLVIPALLAARRWAALGWAVAAGLGWLLASWLAFGTEAWRAFLARLPDAGAAMASGDLTTWQLQSVLAMARTFGLGAVPAQVLQAAVSVAVVLAVAWVLRGRQGERPGGQAEVAAIAAGAPLVTPFVLSYDLVLLLLPTAFVLAQARQSGFAPWEKAGLALAWLLPGLSLGFGLGAGLSFGALAPAILLALVLRRIRAAPLSLAPAPR